MLELLKSTKEVFLFWSNKFLRANFHGLTGRGGIH
jgi:hypothetical protein